MRILLTFFLLLVVVFFIFSNLLLLPAVLKLPEVFLAYTNVISLLNSFDRIGQSYRNTYHYEPQKELKLIGCCLPRTGTVSTKFALESIGYKVYHGGDSIFHRHSKKWMEAIDDPKALDAVIDEILSHGYNATADWPSSHFCLELAKRFPNAKVLLNVRNNPEKWVKSVKIIAGFQSIFVNDQFPVWIFKNEGYSQLMTRLLDENDIGFDIHLQKSIFPWANNKFVYGKKSTMDEESMIRRYYEYIEEAKRVIPKENLLVFNVKEGWGPVGEFLDIEVPNGDFPRANSGNYLLVLYWSFQILIRIYPFIFLGDILFLFWIVYSVWNCCFRRILSMLFHQEKKKRK